ncbi:MAG: hypothetical protein FWB98_07770 [Defluviitaleaceae bacterium]|nr:hypothetical protein [Defluviitaleaceae bacterium]
MFKSKILGVFAVLTLSLLAITASEVQGATSRVINLSTVQPGDSYGNPVQWEAFADGGGGIWVVVHSGANVEVIGSSAGVHIETAPNSNITLNSASFFALNANGNLTLTLLGNNTVSGFLDFRGNTTINGGGSLSTNQIGGMQPATLNLVGGHITADIIAPNLTTVSAGGSLTVGGNQIYPTITQAMDAIQNAINTMPVTNATTQAQIVSVINNATTNQQFLFDVWVVFNLTPSTTSGTGTLIATFGMRHVVTGSMQTMFIDRTIAQLLPDGTPPPIVIPTPPGITPPTPQPEEQDQEPDWWMTLTPNQITFDRRNPQDITVTIGADGPSARNVRQQRIEQVFQGVRTLVEGEDWSIEGNEVTIYAEFLLTLREGRRFINIGDGQIRVDVIETEPAPARRLLFLRGFVWLMNQ